MYLPREKKEEIAESLAEYFHQDDMVQFAKQSAQLYHDYDEFTADDIIKKVKSIFLSNYLTKNL